MKILFACGGTGGHINPAIAIASTLKAKQPDAQILFAGNPKGMEAKLVPQAGFDFAPITIKGFQRKLTWFNIKYNISSLFYLTTASARSKKLIDPNCKELVVGNPVRESIVYADREQARKKLGVGDKMCIVSFGGSQGAHRLNQAMADLIAWHTKEGGPCTGKIHHIHATGKYGVEDFPQMLTERGAVFQENPNVDIREYINDMDDCLAAADLVICRAGASTLSELEAAGRASILIPSPNVAENHQYHNGMVLVKNQAAVLIEEKDLSGQRLCSEVEQLANDPQRLRRLGQNAQKLAMIDANERIYEELMRLLRQPK